MHVADRIDVTLDTVARGPMVFSERADHVAPGFFMRPWHGIGGFLVKDRRIVDCQNFTISMKAVKRGAGDSARRESSV